MCSEVTSLDHETSHILTLPFSAWPVRAQELIKMFTEITFLLTFDL